MSKPSDVLTAERCEVECVHPEHVTPLLGRLLDYHSADRVAATFGVASAILTEAGLSFLGLGVQPPTPSWGNMINTAQSVSVMQRMPWLWIPAGLLIALSVLSINFIGDGLRDALDPRVRER